MAHNGILESSQVYYCTQDPSLCTQGEHARQGSAAPMVGVAVAACLVVIGLTFSPSLGQSSRMLVTAPRVATVASQAQAVQGVRMERSAFGNTVQQADVPAEAQGYEAVTLMQLENQGTAMFSFKWVAAALSAAALPLVYLFNKWNGAVDYDSDFDEEYDSDFDEELGEALEQEAWATLEQESWAMAAVVGVAQVEVKDAAGNVCGSEELSVKTAGVNSRHVIHRKLVAELANRRQGNAHTKTRGEVRGGGKKPYKQKGTGNARRGSTRSPLMKGGGVSHGPRNTRNWKQKVNRKEGRLAISSLIHNRAPLITVVKDMESSVTEISTKTAKQLVNTWAGKDDEKVLLVVEDTEGFDQKNPLYLSTRNIPNVRYKQQLQLAVADLLWPRRILISEPAMAALKERFSA